MSRPILHRLPWLLVLAALCLPAQGRELRASIARVTTPVATLQGVQLRLHWPAGSPRGELTLRAARVEAPELGYRFREVAWRCALARAPREGWRCDGDLRADGGAPARLAVELDAARTEAVLGRGDARLELRRSAATPEATEFDLSRVPLVWAQALAAQAWPEGRLTAGRLDGSVRVLTPARAPLRVEADLRLDGGGFESADATAAAQGLDGAIRVDYRALPASDLLALDGSWRGGELLFGNAYVSLPATPLPWRLDAMRRGDDGWALPTIAWHDGRTLDVQGSAAFAPDGALRALELAARSDDIAPLAQRYLSGWLGVAGLSGLEMRGGFDGRMRVERGTLEMLDARLHAVSLRAADGRFRFDGLDGDLRFAAGADAVDSTLRWRGGALGEVAFGAATLPMRSGGGVLRLRDTVAVPMLDGRIGIDGFELRPPAGERGLRIASGLTLDALDLGTLAAALGGPDFRGTISGRIPVARYAEERLDFDGDLVMQVFDGTVQISGLAMERPFGVAPTLSADLDLQNLDLLTITEVFDFGSISGRLQGRISGLRLIDWSPTAFDATLRTVPRRGVRQRISQRAVQNISSVGDASFVTSLQGQLIGLFDEFGYRRIGLSCRLANEVCTMGGLRSAGDGFTIVEGAGVPRLNVVGFNRRVDWPTLVDRVAAAVAGDTAPTIE